MSSHRKPEINPAQAVAAAAKAAAERAAAAASAASAVGCVASKPPLYHREYSQDRDRLFALHLRPARPLTRANAVVVPKTPDQASTSYPAPKRRFLLGKILDIFHKCF